MSAASGTKFGRFLVQNSAALLPKHRPLLALNSAACLYKKRLPSGTKFGRFIAQKSAPFWHYIQLLACTKSG
jgi:hypothetical protein